jgi:probable F420-dependent oxidoreductase
MALPLGLVTPVVSLNPRVARDWEVTAGVDDVVEVARAADRAGFHHLTCSEHVAVPDGALSSVGTPRGTRYFDPAVTLTWLAAATTTIRLATHVLVAGLHHPLEVAKTYGTLDVLSGGRVVLGIGVGSLRAEFDVLGRPFDGRGERADEFLRALRAVWGEREPTHAGPVYPVRGVVVDPCATTVDPTLWVGGRTGRSLRRALDLGDGWVPFGLTVDELAALLARARADGAWERRRRPFDVVLGVEELDPLGDPAGATARLEERIALGATAVDVRFRHRSRDHLVEQVEAASVLAAGLEPAGQ